MAPAAPAPALSPSSEIATDGPALNLVNKRLRALRKKLNRIAQMADSVSQGKTLNKEQEETLRSKSSVLAGIDEFEKLKQPLLQAVSQEIELALEKNKQKPDPAAEIPSEAASTVEAEEKSGTPASDSAVSDLLNLLYFGTVFDVKTLFLARDSLLTRTHERNCCLTYDCITDDDAAGDLLKEPDLDLIASLGSLLFSRPVNSSLSHKNALQKCVEHAKLWLANAEQPIEPASNVTYAGLREKLNKIMASAYFTPISIGGGSGDNKENPDLNEEWSLPNIETSLVLLRLHAKHIAVCRCVCKSWLSLTTSPGFISAQLDHARSESDPQFLFHDSVAHYEREKAPVKPTQSGLVCFSPDTLIIGSINGLICSTGNWTYCSSPTPNDIWIWNPSTGLSKKLPMGIRRAERFSNIQATFAFCWDQESDVYKVVRIISKKREPTFAEVWSSDINSWEEIYFTNPSYIYHPSNFMNLVPTTFCNVFIRNSPHWAVLDYDGNPFIMSFDVKTNKLKLFSFPSQLSSDLEEIAMTITNGLWRLIVTNWKGDLAVLDYVGNRSTEAADLATLDDTQCYPYRLWTMDADGHWTRSCLVSFHFDFNYCLNSVGGGKYMLLQTPWKTSSERELFSEIVLYDIGKSRVIRTYEIPKPFSYISSAFDFVGSLVSMEGSEPFRDNFSKLITLTWPSHLQMNLNLDRNLPRKQLFMLPEEVKFFADGMERDPAESPLPAPFWEVASSTASYRLHSSSPPIPLPRPLTSPETPLPGARYSFDGAAAFLNQHTNLEIIIFLLKSVTGLARDDDCIKTDNLFCHREPGCGDTWVIDKLIPHALRWSDGGPWVLLGLPGHFGTLLMGQELSSSYVDLYWCDGDILVFCNLLILTIKFKATPILSLDRRVIIGYRRTFRYQTKAKSNSDKGSWLMTKYVLPDTAIKCIKEEYKNFAMCVLKKKTKKIANKPRVGSGLGDYGVECSCSCNVVASFADCRDQGDDVDFGYVGPEQVQITDEDWIHELEESIMDDHHDDVMRSAADECPGSSPGGAFPLADDVVFGEVGPKAQRDDDDDWIHELEESMMDHEKLVDESGLVSKVDGIGGPLLCDDPSFEKELLDFFDFELPADDHVLWDNQPDNGSFFWQDLSSTAPLITGS
ncbi:F-box and associated interaction domains-containing protein [Striga asiatica]|uniref:F-box and associated interaction domains-containing protein n=1 Tax=Striga asiatica TaxID=4170 RepID=A0A5A7QQA5_STRAF|nr:F-box and associated interaction domains-containing protein [Striga asiatica]